MDLVITLSIYLPRPTFPTLFSFVAVILPQSSDPQLQKKAYKLLPRLATSPTGTLALQDRNAELQALLLNTASTVSAPARRDRLAAVAVVVEHLPQTSLHFIPSVLSEVVISAKEVNEKARTAAFDLLVLMAKKMSQGGHIDQSKIPNMPADAPIATASLEEFFTMVSAGLVGSTPHMISASITALTRILYEFSSQLPQPVIEEIVTTLDLYLADANREIVRSVLGFVKVAIISLPESIIKPRLETLIPGLTSWSREHKAHFRAKVKHILERAIRRFGYDTVELYCPEDQKKFIHNIRKTKERRKRHKATDAAEGGTSSEPQERRKGRFESEYDEAIYGSDSSASDTDTDQDSPPTRDSTDTRGTYITEDPSEPLDLLDRKSLAHISSRKPLPKPTLSSKQYRNTKTDADGKLVFGDHADDAMALDFDQNGNNEGVSLETGINAYVDAIRGRDAVQRGRGGRLKFSNKREKGGGGEGGMDVDDADNGDEGKGNGKGEKRVRFSDGVGKGMGKEREGMRGNGKSFARGRGGIAGRVERRGLGGGGSGRAGGGGLKMGVRGGRVSKGGGGRR